MSTTVYLNGEYLPDDEARISPSDRGFLFADGIYEVTSAYRGRLFRMEGHQERMARGLAELRIDFDVSVLPRIHRRLLEENDLLDQEVSSVYLQVTRGAAPRAHAFPPPGTQPTVYAVAGAHQRPSDARWNRGFAAVTVPDRRWSRVDIKTVALIPNVLAYQAAKDAGVADAILVRDGVALEGAVNNLFFVFDGALTTHPATHRILGGITREVVLELAGALQIPVVERAVQVEEVDAADEIFFSGTITEIRPCVEVDGRRVGSGEVGPIARRLRQAFLQETRKG